MMENRVSAGVTNALTIDVEDYFQVSALAPHFPRAKWDDVPCRVEANVDRILGLLHEYGTKATFFTLGWIAERYPKLVRLIIMEGHELASHGYGHERASAQTADAFRADVSLAKAVLEDISGVEIRGYRAPSFSIGATNLWAHDVLRETGHVYSSSVYPIAHDHYGMPDSPRFPYYLSNGLLEIPVTTVRCLGRNWPAAGGGYFRLLPYPVSRWSLQRVNQRDHRSAIFYFHPWEIDPAQPKVAAADARTRFRHYVNLDHMESRLRRLLGDFEWDRADRVFLPKA
ncbi:XrtA system polysaccharide deacetylase [Niveibacterium umoris]|uniref:Polysaccharide deacetylase family protein (PEP-CTERM system associated) n=1 Tax=Niveibacterium umoris TaxID=1193620 RepID=A0A840BJ16_9RHOO|nr:XrtA system polysaccharide deacetylase [Niveibacterium umoris]MBB4012334.1 polysaccharide deacetylase family protein (PEP-CTERM system associated) [Niveibacterium umoris]